MAINFSAGPPSVQLTNSQRSAMGLLPVEEDWEWGRFSGVDSAPETEYWAAFQGDILRKVLVFSPTIYEEREMAEQTLEGRSKILPRSGKGKPRPISLYDLERKPLGMYLRFWGGQHQLFLQHTPSKRTYYDASLDRNGIPRDLSGFLEWAARWEAETTSADRAELAELLQSGAKKQSYREGDFFRFPLGRREFGYGRILQNVRAWIKAKKPFWDVLQGTRPLLVAPCRVLTQDPDLTPEELRELPLMPSFYLNDFHLAVGDYPIVGNLPLEAGDTDHPIRYGKAVPWRKTPTVIFQCGPIYRELEGAEPPAYCDKFQNWGVKEDIFTTRDQLEKSVFQNSNEPYCNEHLMDLRSRAFRPELRVICQQMGLTIEELPAKLW